MALPARAYDQQGGSSVESIHPRIFSLLDRLEEFFSSSSAENKREFFSSLCLLAPLALDWLARYLGWYASVDQETDILQKTLAVLASLIALGSVYLSLGSLFRSALQSLRLAELNSAVCQSLAITLLSTYLIFDTFFLNGVEQQHFFALSLALICFLLNFERALVSNLYRSLSRSYGFRIDKLTPRVSLEGGPGAFPQEVSISEIKVGDIFRLRDGQICPCDAEIIHGCSSLIERRDGTCPQVVFKSTGDEILAGSLLNGAALTCKANTNSQDSSIAYFSDSLNVLLAQADPHDHATLGLVSLVTLIAACFGAIFWFQAGASLAFISAVASSFLLLSFIERYFDLRKFEDGLALSSLFAKGILLRSLQSFKRALQAKRLVFDSPQHIFGISLLSFESLDQRVESARLRAVTVNLLSRSQDLNFRKLAAVLAEDQEKIDPFSVTDFFSYPNWGVCGVIASSEFSLGNEDFLLERGVYLEQSDLFIPQDSRSKVMYLALGDEVVARFVYQLDDASNAAKSVRKLSRLGVRVIACGAETGDDFDRVGKALGLELVNVFGGLSPQIYREKLRDLNPVAILFGASMQPELEREATLSLSFFDPISYSCDATDVSLFDRDLSLVAHFFALLRQLRSISLFNLSVSAAFTLCCIVGVATGIIGPALAVLISACLHFIFLRRLNSLTV